MFGSLLSEKLSERSERLEKLVLISVTANKGARDWRVKKEEIFKEIQKAKRDNKIVIISAHGGCEGASAAKIPIGSEICFGENRGSILDFANESIDKGADMFIGHGSHVPRALSVQRED